MEGPYYSNNNPKIPKIKGINGNVLPINAQMDAQFSIGRGRYHPSKSPTFESYTSPNSLDNMDSTLLRYLRSGSSACAGIVQSAGDAFAIPVVDAAKYRPMMVHPYHSNINGNGSFGSRGSSASPLSAVENLETPPSRSPPVFKTPGKVEEEVLVMDGILVGLVTGVRMRSASSDSGGSSSGNSLYKTEICRSWEDSGSCRYGSKCQFAHGKEELRPTRFAIKNKFEPQMCKSYGSSGSSCTHGPKCRFVHQALSAEATKAEAATAQTAPSIKPQCADTITSRDWSPQDDGIEVVLPASSSTHKPPAWEDVDAYIHDVLYSPGQRKRLPVFAEICPE